MAFPQDLTQWRVYSAEQSLPPGQQFENLDEAATYLWWVQSTRWWKTTLPGAPTITLEIGGNSNGVEVQSFAQETGDDTWKVSLHPRMMNAVVLLHEVAHCIAPTKTGNIKEIAKGKLSFGSHHHHGPYFRAAFAALAERYQIGVDPDELRRAYEHFELETPGIEELVEARAHSVEVERAVAVMWERHEREWASDPKRIEMQERAQRAREEHEAELVAKGHDLDADRAEDGGWIPRRWWGDWIWLTRRHDNRTSQRRLAELVSPVVKCSARDVARLERLREAPTSTLDWQRCLAFVAVLGLDPVWAETHYGLAAGETSLSLAQLDAIAPDWAADVRHLNALLAARPPRWEAPGDR